MKTNTFNVHFILRNNRIDKNGFCPIYARVTIKGKLLQISINHKTDPEDWDTVKERVRQRSISSELVNNVIESYKSRIYQAYSKIISSNEELNIQNFKIALYGKADEKKVYTLVQTTVEHNSHFERMVGIKYSYGSYKNYKTRLKYLIEFIPQFCQKEDILLTQVNYKFCEMFFAFLTTQKTCKVNGANKQLQRLKKIINYAIRNEYISNNPYGNLYPTIYSCK